MTGSSSISNVSSIGKELAKYKLFVQSIKCNYGSGIMSSVEVEFRCRNHLGKAPDLRTLRKFLDSMCKEYEVYDYLQENPSDSDMVLVIKEEKDEEKREMLKKEFKNR